MDIVPPLPSAQAPQGEGSDARVLQEAASTPASSRFARVLTALGERIDRGEHLIDGVTRAPPHLSHTELLALQAGIYRYTEAVELASKLVDRAGNAVKTTLQSQ